jgi:hypothetical protein
MSVYAALHLQGIKSLPRRQPVRKRSPAVPDRERVFTLRRRGIQQVRQLPRPLSINALQRIERVLPRIKYFRFRMIGDLICNIQKRALWAARSSLKIRRTVYSLAGNRRHVFTSIAKQVCVQVARRKKDPPAGIISRFRGVPIEDRRAEPYLPARAHPVWAALTETAHGSGMHGEVLRLEMKVTIIVDVAKVVLAIGAVIYRLT